MAISQLWQANIQLDIGLDDEYEVPFSLSRWLESGDSISSFTVTLTDNISLVAIGFSDAIGVPRIKGRGIASDVERITYQFITANGDKINRSVNVRVRDL